MSNHLHAIPPSLLAYVAGPYTVKNADGSENKKAIAKRMHTFYMCMSYLTHFGIKACSPLLMDEVRKYNPATPGDWEYWGEYSRVMLMKCDVLIVLTMPGWETSMGVAGEINIAKSRNIPVIYVDPEELIPNIYDDREDDGTILVKISNIQSNTVRRLAIAGSIVPMLAINMLLLTASIVGSVLGTTRNLFRSAKKHW